ncbi:armadillo repeat-containing protein 2 [Lycodopsis pacificus]
MASMDRKHEVCSPFIPRGNAVRKTSAEIVSEARRSLRVHSTQRPFTPRDGHRQLFGKSTVCADREGRPPSTFSLHAQNFDAPDSRPGSGTRLSPLDHKPKFPVHCDVEDPFKAFPKTPSAPLEVKKGVRGTRARLLRAGSLTTLSAVEGHKDMKERLNPGPAQKQLSAKRLPSTDHTEVRSGPHKPGLRRTASESRIKQPGVDSGVRLTESAAGRRTEQGNGVNTTSTEEDAESLVWSNTIALRLRQLERVAAAMPGSSEGSVDRLCDLCDGLHGTLAEADMLGRRCKRRSGILRTLFRLVDLNSARLNLHIAELCLALCVSGNNLLNICKLIFQISRSESNDILFQNNSHTIIDSFLGILKNEDVSSSGEALLYCVGTLKFLSGNSAVLRLLLDKNCVGVAQKLIQRLCTAEDTNFTIAGHILVQLTATLRNLADHPDSRPLFISFSILSELCVVLRHHRRDPDICTNISRIYSKLSSYSECRLALAQNPNCYQLFLELLNKHHQKQDLVVRLLFTLGNLTAKSDEARWQLFQCEGCMDTLLQLYDAYQRRDGSPHTQPQKGPQAPPAKVQQDEDVLVKLVRVLANMCIHPAVGPALATHTACIQLLMETLELRCVQESEELLVNVAATINNLSFYQEESSVFRRSQLTVAKLMLKLVLCSSMDAMLEATCAYGNLSQSKDVRDFIMQNNVHQFVVTLLDSKSTEMCISACGVLTNLAQDPPNRASLSVEGALAKLVDCLRDFGPGDWQLVGQVCQALWNMISGGSEKLLDTQERESLLEILTTYLDEEEALKWIENEDMRDFHRACWELEFLPVAHKLMKTLQPPDQTA